MKSFLKNIVLNSYVICFVLTFFLILNQAEIRTLKLFILKSSYAWIF